MKTSSQYQALLEKRGVHLTEEFGIADVALERDVALIAADLLVKDGITILGGDVFLRKGGRLELAYANWFTQQYEGEESAAYVDRAWSETKEYIRNFPIKEDETPLFVLVVSPM